MPDQTARLATALQERYLIEGELGQGGMASVYLAHDVRHNRKVALKVLRPDVVEQLGAQRFLHEIRIAANLSHPHILPVFDSGERDGVLYYVMPYVQGDSLRARLDREGPLAIREAVRILRDVADALAYAHTHGVVHRDVKPDNVMLAGRHALVADFGVARALSYTTGSHQVTTAGVALGTPTYMAPEQAVADPNIDHRVDIYAFGVLAYEVLTGRPPFVGPAVAVMAAHVTRTPDPIARHRPDVPPGLAELVHRCLAKDPADRLQTLDDAVGLLESTVTPSGGLPRTGSAPAISAAVPAPAGPSIAVLPFKNLSADPENEYFADGMTEEIINALSQLPSLKVAARTSAFAFKGQEQDVRTIGERLGVGSVLEGSIRQAGRRVRITAQLVNVADGYHLWSQRYDRDLEDIFAIQDEIASAITEALTARLVAAPVPVKRARVDAYDLYLKGRYHWNKRTITSMRQAAELFEQALAKDPDYAPAYAGLADCYGLLGWVAFGAIPPDEAFPRAETAARKALALDPVLAEAHTALAWCLIAYRWDWPEAESHFRRALEANPRYAMGHSWYGLSLIWVGRPDEAFEQSEEAIELDPLALIILTLAGWVSYFAGRYEESIALYQRTLELDAHYVRAHLGLGWAYEQTGDLEAAIREFQQGEELSGRSPGYVAALGHAFARAGSRDEALQQLRRLTEAAASIYVSPSYFAAVHAGLGDADRTFEWLEKAYEARSGAMVYLHLDPQFRRFRDDPRFQALCDRVGIAGAKG